MYSKATIVSLFLGLAAAQLHAPVGEPKGNPITRPLNEVSLFARGTAITNETDPPALGCPHV